MQQTETKVNDKKSAIPQFLVLGMIVAMLIFGVVMFMKFFVPDYLRRGMQEDLLKGNHSVAEAQVIAIFDTGRRYSKTPVIQFTLNVMPENQKNFQLILEQETPWFRLNGMAPENKIQIYYNPEDPEQAVIK